MGFVPTDDEFDAEATAASILDGSYFDTPAPAGAKAPPPRPTAKNALTQAELEDVLREAGWEEDLIPKMSAIGMAESTLTPDNRAKVDSYNPGVGPGGRKTVEESVGLWQINMHPSLKRNYDRKKLATDPVYNAKAALEIYNKQGLKAWGAFTDGRYKKHYKGKPQSAPQPFDAEAAAAEIFAGIDIPGPTDPVQAMQPASTAPVTELPATLERQRQAAMDPASSRIGVLYTDSKTAPEPALGEYDIPIQNGQLLRTNASKLMEYLQATGTKIGDIMKGTADFTPLIGGKAEPTGEQYGTQGQIAVITYDEDGVELVADAITDPTSIATTAALHKKQFPGRKIRTEIVTGEDVVAGREQAPADPFAGTQATGTASTATMAEGQGAWNEPEQPAAAEMPADDAAFDEANAYLASQGQPLITREQFDAAQKTFGSSASASGYSLANPDRSEQAGVSDEPEPTKAPAVTRDFNLVHSNRNLTQKQLMGTDVAYVIDLSQATGNKQEFAAQQARQRLVEDFGISAEQAAEFVPKSKKPYTDADQKVRILINRGELADLIGVERVAQDYQGEIRSFETTDTGLQAGIKSREAIDERNIIPAVDKAVDRSMTVDADLTEKGAEKELDKVLRTGSYYGKQQAAEWISNPLNLFLPYALYNMPDVESGPSEEWVGQEKERLLGQHGSYKTAYGAELSYQNTGWGETALRGTSQVLRSFTKNVFGATAKSAVFLSQLGEWGNPANLVIKSLANLGVVPEGAEIGLRNVGNAADYLLRLVSSRDAGKAAEETTWVKGTDPIAQQHIFRAAQEFDKAIGDDEKLKGRFFGALADGAGSALAFVALGTAMPAIATRSFWGVTRNWTPALSGVLQMAGPGYEEGVKNGLTENQARAYGVIQGVLGLSEMFGAGAELSTFLKNPFLKGSLATGILQASKTLGQKAAKTAFKEAKEEFAQEVFQTTAGNAVLEYLKDKNPSELARLTAALNRLPKQLATAIANEGVIASITGGLMGGATGTIQQVSEWVAGDVEGTQPPVNPRIFKDYSLSARKDFLEAVRKDLAARAESGEITDDQAEKGYGFAEKFVDGKLAVAEPAAAPVKTVEDPDADIVPVAAEEFQGQRSARLLNNVEPKAEPKGIQISDKDGESYTVIEDRGDKGFLVEDAKGVQKVWPLRKFDKAGVAEVRDQMEQAGLKSVPVDSGETRVVYRLGWANETNPSGRYVGDADRVAKHINATEENRESSGDTLFAYRVPANELLWTKQKLGNAAVLPDGSKAELISATPYGQQYKDSKGKKWESMGVEGDHIREAFGQQRQPAPTRYATPKISTVSQIKKGAIPEDTWSQFNKDVFDAVPAISVMVDPNEVTLTRPVEKMDREEMISGKKHELVRAYNHVLDVVDGSPVGRKRDPIEVYKNEDGTYTVADGNATVELAKRLGWSKVPAVITKKPAGTIAPVNEKIAQLSRDVLDVAEGAKEGYFRDARAAAAQVGGVVPANLRQYLTKSLRSLNKKLQLKSDKVPTDLLRTTIIIPAGPAEQARQAAASVVESMGKNGYSVLVGPDGQPDVTDRFADPSPGYKDISIKFVREDGPVVYELQMLQPAAFLTKTGVQVDPATGRYRTTKREGQHINYDRVKDLQDAIMNDPNLTPKEVKKGLRDIVAINAVMADAYAQAFAEDTGFDASILDMSRPSETMDSSSADLTGTPSESRNRTKASADVLSEVVAKNLATESLSSTDRALKFFNDSDIYTSSSIVADSQGNTKPLSSSEEVGLKKVDPSRTSALGVFSEKRVENKDRSAKRAIEVITKHMSGGMQTPIKEATSSEVEDAFYRNALADLGHWLVNYRDGYVSFYGEDIAKANEMLQEWAKTAHGRELAPHEIDLFHLLGSLSASGVMPREDSALATLMLDRYLRDGTISALDPMRFRPEFVGGEPTGNIRFETDPTTGKSVVGTSRYSTKVRPEPINTFVRVLDHFKGDLKKAMAWINTSHPLQELLDVSGQAQLPSHEYLDTKNGGKGVFSLFSGTGAKLGSYYLNRIGNLETVTKDMWYGRGEARYLGLPLAHKDGKAIGGPVESNTVYGRRVRVAEDAAVKRLAKNFKVEPAVIQQWLWDFEQRLWEHAGMPATKPSYISTGVADGIERLGLRSAAGERSAATVGVGVVREGTGKTSADTVTKFAKKAYKEALATNDRIIKAFNVNTSGTQHKFTVLNLHQQQNTVGVWEGTSGSMKESALYTVSGPADLVKAFAVTSSILAPNPQQAVMLDTYDRNGEGDETHITFKDMAALEGFVADRAKYNAGNLSLNPTTKTVIIVHNQKTDERPLKIEEIDKDYGDQITQYENRSVSTDFIDESAYRGYLQEARDSVQRHYPGKRGQSISAILDEADARLRKAKPELYEEAPLKSVAPLENSLGIPRSEMPQIRRDDHAEFIGFAKDRGVDIVEDSVRAGDLLPTQNEYNPEQAAQLPERAFDKRLMVSADNRVLDGHNTLVRLQENPDRAVDVWRVDLPATEALGLMKDFPKVGYKTVAEVGPADSALKRAKTAKSVQHRAELELASTKAVLDRLRGGTLHENGELELNEADAELLRRLLAERYFQRTGEEIDELPFDGIVWSTNYLRNLAEFGRTTGREQLKSAGMTEAQLAKYDDLMNALDATADANEGYSIAYVYDTALPHERVHKEDRNAGGVSPINEANLLRMPIAQTAGTVFDEAYPHVNSTDKLSELVAIIASGEAAIYGLSTDVAAQQEFLRMWADAVIENNTQEIDAIGFPAWAQAYPLISAMATQKGEEYAENNQSTENAAAESGQAQSTGAVPGTSVSGQTEESQETVEGPPAGTQASDQVSDAGQGLATDAEIASATGRTINEVRAQNRKFAQTLADNLMDVGVVEYEPQTVEGWKTGAAETIEERGVDAAIEEYHRLPAGASEGRKTALGVAIAVDLYTEGRTADLTEFGRTLTENIGNAAQELRAAALMSRLSPAFAGMYGDKVVMKAKHRVMTAPEREQIETLARQLEEAADAHALSQAALAEAQGLNEKFDERIKELEGMLAESQKAPAPNADLQAELDKALKALEDYKKQSGPAAFRVKGPKALRETRQKIETERPEIVALLQNYFPDTTLKSVSQNGGNPLGGNRSGQSGLVGTVPASDLERLSNLRRALAEDLGNLFISKAGVTESFGKLDVIRRRRVLSVMGRLAQDLQVADAVIRLVPVDVMDVLAGKKVSPEMLRHDPSMLVDLLPRNTNNPVPAAIKAVDVLAPAMARAVAEIATRLGGVDVRTSDLLPAGRTDSHISKVPYPSEVVNDRDIAIESVLKKVDPQTLTPQFRNWFKDSKVVDEDGKPETLHHGTMADVETFKRRGLGIHLGTRRAAEQIFKTKQGPRVPETRTSFRDEPWPISKGGGQEGRRNPDGTWSVWQVSTRSGFGDYKLRIFGMNSLDFPTEAKAKDAFFTRYPPDAPIGGNVMPIYAAIRNPAEISDPGNDEPQDLANDLYNRGVFTVREAAGVRTNAQIRKMLREKGYDGAYYINSSEDPGSTSWVAFDPTQIKSALGNSGAFDPNEGSILKSTIPNDLNVPPEAIEALVKLGAAKLIDEVPTGLTPQMFDKWLNEITGGRLGPREVAVVHALAHNMTRPAYSPQDAADKALAKNRLAHRQRADRIMLAEDMTDVTDEGIAAYKAAHTKQGPKKPTSFVQAVINTGEQMGMEEEAVMMALAMKVTSSERELKKMFAAKFPDGNFAKAMNAGKQLLDLTKDQITQDKWEQKHGKDLTAKQINDLKNAIKTEATEERLKKKALERAFKALTEDTKDKVWGAISSVYNLPRSIMFSGDLGFLLAQGMPTLLMHPTAWWKAVTTGIPAGLTDKWFEQAITAAYETEMRKRLETGGVKFEQIGNVADFNDDFMSDIARWLPFVKQTNRMHSITTDLFRLYGGSADLMELDKMYEAGKLGKTPEENALNYNRSKEFLTKKWVNVMSGKGYLGALDPMGKALAQVGSAPRYTVSAFQIPYYANPLRAAMLPKGARKIMMKNSAKLWIPIITMMVVLSKLGLINDDPEDKDFLVIDMGKLSDSLKDMKINPLRAIKEPVRLTVGLPAKMLYYAYTGNKEGYERIAKSYYAAFVVDSYGGIGSFWKSKLHPTLSTTSQLYTGKNFVGEPLGWMDVLPLPLVIKEGYQAWTYDHRQSVLKTGADTGKFADNWQRIAATIIGSVIGFGANSYPASDTTTATKQLLSMKGGPGDDPRTDEQKTADGDPTGPQTQRANQLERLIREGDDVSELIPAMLATGELTKKQATQLAKTLADDLGDVQAKFGMEFTEAEKAVLMNNRKALKVLDYLYTGMKLDWRKIDSALKFTKPGENKLADREALAAAEAIVMEQVLKSKKLIDALNTDQAVQMYKGLSPRMDQQTKDAFLEKLEKKTEAANKSGGLKPEELENVKSVMPWLQMVPRPEGTSAPVYKIMEKGSVEKALTDNSVKRWSTNDWVEVLKNAKLSEADRLLAEAALKKKAENARKSKTLTPDEVKGINSVMPKFKIQPDDSRGKSTTKKDD